MTFWNYRLFKNSNGDFSVREVYYNEKNEVEFWVDRPCSPFGEDLEEITSDINKFSEALIRPILDENELNTTLGIGEIPDPDDIDEDFQGM